jgi:hypothetical protein
MDVYVVEYPVVQVVVHKHLLVASDLIVLGFGLSRRAQELCHWHVREPPGISNLGIPETPGHKADL